MTTRELGAKRRNKGTKYFFLGAGGGGKSTAAMLFASTILARGVPLRLYDMDPGTPTLRRYCTDLIDDDQILFDDDPSEVVDFLEETVFGTDEDAVVDAGANLEASILRWTADRGAARADSMRFIIVVGKKDGVSAASRIHENARGVPTLLLYNEGGRRFARIARATEIYQGLLADGVPEAVLPLLGRTLEVIHETSVRPDRMLLDSNLFAKQGATSLIRTVEGVFAAHPDFRPW